MRAPLATALTGALLVAGCGGDAGPGSDDAERVVREFVTAVNARDGQKICTELVTDAYVRETTSAQGPEARRACERQIRTLDGNDSRLTLVRLRDSRVDGDRATVVADVRAGRQTRRTTFRLRRQGDGFRLESGTGS